MGWTGGGGGSRGGRGGGRGYDLGIEGGRRRRGACGRNSGVGGGHIRASGRVLDYI